MRLSRGRIARRAPAVFALAATLLLAVPAGALAAGPRLAEGGDGWALIWQRLADAWDGMRSAVTGLVPTWEKDSVPSKPVLPPPPTEPPPPEDTDPFDDGDEGSGINPDG